MWKVVLLVVVVALVVMVSWCQQSLGLGPVEEYLSIVGADRSIVVPACGALRGAGLVSCGPSRCAAGGLEHVLYILMPFLCQNETRFRVNGGISRKNHPFG